MITPSQCSIVIPAKNEAAGLSILLPKLTDMYPESEIIVVNDGSTDETEQVCRQNKVLIITHNYSKGNGSAIKTGARASTKETIIFMDADGQHRPQDIAKLIDEYNKGYAMVVGARPYSDQASITRAIGNKIYNNLASWMTEKKIKDLTSGFRIVNRKKFNQFLYLLPNGFSYPTTCTMAFFRAGYSVNYVNIESPKREGKSHISITKDGLRFFLIIFKIGVLYSPLKVFIPISFFLFLIGLIYYLYTFLIFSRFTNMSALLFTSSITIFLIGLVSEQITMLIYKESSPQE